MRNKMSYVIATATIPNTSEEVKLFSRDVKRGYTINVKEKHVVLAIAVFECEQERERKKREQQEQQEREQKHHSRPQTRSFKEIEKK